MATRLKDMVGAGPEALAEAVAASAQQIWQAGLGAFARAQQEGGALFDTLVREGAELHKLTQQADGGDKAGRVADKVGRLAENVGRQASGSWDRIEKIFEDRVARAMRSLGVPAHEEVLALRRELEALRHEVEALQAAQAARRTSTTQPARKAAAAPAAAKGAAPKRPARTVAGRHA